MIKVKICGLKEEEDLIFLKNFSVDYIGFIMYVKSPRYVGDRLKNFLSFPIKAKKVVVFVDPSFEEVKKTLDYGADFIQLHGNESIEFAKKIGLQRVIKAFRIKDEKFDLKILDNWKNTHAILLDTFVKNMPGGTGKTFNWNIAKKIVSKGFKVFLAGGITPKNAIDAIKVVKPYALDISSGVELYPGKKDFSKIQELFACIKSYT